MVNIINSASTPPLGVNAAIPTAMFLANALNSGAPVATAEGAIEAAEGAAAPRVGGLGDAGRLGAKFSECHWSAGCRAGGLVYTVPATTAGATALEGGAADRSPKKPAQLPMS